MKIRSDFVTNSSSSSFILAFDKDEDKSKFLDRCNELNYELFSGLIQHLVSDRIEIVNFSEDMIYLNPILDLIKKKELPISVKNKIDELYLKEIKLGGNKNIFIDVYNPFYDEDFVDLSMLNFDDLDADEYAVYFIDNARNRDREEIKKNLKFWKDLDLKEELREKKKVSDDNLEKEYEDELNKLNSRIDSANLVLQGEIWDSYGGILEWAIRNGFIKDSFYENFVFQIDIG